jgi:hypothetical protein
VSSPCASRCRDFNFSGILAVHADCTTENVKKFARNSHHFSLFLLSVTVKKYKNLLKWKSIPFFAFSVIVPGQKWRTSTLLTIHSTLPKPMLVKNAPDSNLSEVSECLTGMIKMYETKRYLRLRFT